MGFKLTTKAQLATIMNANSTIVAKREQRTLIIPSGVVCLQKQKRKRQIYTLVDIDGILQLTEKKKKKHNFKIVGHYVILIHSFGSTPTCNFP